MLNVDCCNVMLTVMYIMLSCDVNCNVHNVDCCQSKYPLSQEKLLDCKEVFMLFDRDVDGVLSLSECLTALHTMGYRLHGMG